MLWSSQDIQKKLIESLPTGSTVEVIDTTGTSDHFEVNVISSAFVGKSPIARHRLIYDILGSDVGGAIHALSIRAQTPN